MLPYIGLWHSRWVIDRAERDVVRGWYRKLRRPGFIKSINKLYLNGELNRYAHEDGKLPKSPGEENPLALLDGGFGELTPHCMANGAGSVDSEIYKTVRTRNQHRVLSLTVVGTEGQMEMADEG